VVTSPPPTGREHAQHYLWRFWKSVPKQGYLTIFDRSWYARCWWNAWRDSARRHAWRRAYEEINEFERMLVDGGIAVIKFWLHIDQDEQLRRFKAREETSYKNWKITEEDWRNRGKWRNTKCRRGHDPENLDHLFPLDRGGLERQTLTPGSRCWKRSSDNFPRS